MGGRSQLFGQGFRYALAGTLCGLALAPLGLAHANGTVTAPESIVVGGRVDQVPPEVVVPPVGVVVRVKAPPANKRSASWADRRTEIGRRMMVEMSATGRDVAEIVVPYAGGPLPPEALDPPPDTVVLLEHVPGLAGSTARDLAPAAGSALASVPDIVLEYAGGPLPEEATSPPPGVVVGLLASSRPADNEARESVAEAFPDVEAAFVIDVPYMGGALPAEAIDPPPDTVIRLQAPLEGEAFAAAASAAPLSQARSVTREIVVPYRNGKLPKIALAPPPDTVIMLRAP